MADKIIGALTIGQSPRPDLVHPLMHKLSNHCQIIQSGALDGMTKAALPPVGTAAYPLTTRLNDGTSVIVDEAYLTAKLQHALERLEEQGAAASILLCAGTFAELKGTRPLFKPFAIGRDLLHLLGYKRLGLIVPIKEQEAPIMERWRAAGFQSVAWSADLAHQGKQFVLQLHEQVEKNGLECIVLDYVGHPVSTVKRLQQKTAIPVIDLGELAIAALTAVL